jgi:hypothetical protein
MLIKVNTWLCLQINAGRSHNIKIDNSSFEWVEEFNIWEQS